jgi:two-component system, cell cycle response regulator DivK
MVKILVVEDDPINCNLVSRFLRREGYQVVLAGDGRQGVELARSEHPDLVLMDLNLPELDGWEATRSIRSTPETAHIPVIVVSSQSQSGDVHKALEAGCNHFETKPVNYLRLMKKIATFLPS